MPQTMKTDLDHLLINHQEALRLYVERHASSRLLRYETPEDLVQGIFYTALRAASQFVYRSEKEFFGWIYLIARRHIYDRSTHWYALKRNAGKVLRVAQQETGILESRPAIDPAAD